MISEINGEQFIYSYWYLIIKVVSKPDTPTGQFQGSLTVIRMIIEYLHFSSQININYAEEYISSKFVLYTQNPFMVQKMPRTCIISKSLKMTVGVL